MWKATQQYSPEKHSPHQTLTGLLLIKENYLPTRLTPQLILKFEMLSFHASKMQGNSFFNLELCLENDFVGYPLIKMIAEKGDKVYIIH